MGIFQKFLKKPSAATIDSQNLYTSIMKQSRKADFFGTGKVPDSYDGRIEFLTLHMSIIMAALNTHAVQGKRLSQALFDVMVDDFDTALREEGLTDSGVKRRIKPMIALFYTRLTDYSENLKEATSLKTALGRGAIGAADDLFLEKLGDYGASLAESLAKTELGSIAKTKFNYPDF